MKNLSITDLAQEWFGNSQNFYSSEFFHNKLFRMLYTSYRSRHGVGKSFEDLSYQSGDHYKACAQLYSWYVNRYGIELNMPTGSQGQKRTSGRTNDEYTFDRIYCDDRQFKNYLLTPLPQSGSQDLLAFVLHTAVAFLVPLKELDMVLQYLGFHPLHVKNIHHMTIAYVLLSANSRTADINFNPFTEVKKLYFKALKILENNDAPAEDSYNYANMETMMIRDMLLLRKGLTTQNFEALVARNRAALNMRHSMILTDFHKLSSVFIHIFDSNADPDSFELPEDEYSFYHFVMRFCKEDLSRKKFREQMTSMIDMKQKHPTRSAMIILWLYTYCFAFLPGVYIKETTFRRISKQLKKTNPEWAEEAKAYFQGEWFDVYGFITNQLERSIPKTFRGSDLITFLNETLLLRYGWGPLNDKLPFDHYIYALKDLTLEMSSHGLHNGASYGVCRLVGLEGEVDNVPFPLVAVTQIFEKLAQLHIKIAALIKYEKLSPCPLKCSLYEQL